MIGFWDTFFWLMVGHAMADYVWQPEWMARHKSPWNRPEVALGPWWWAMTAHSLINAGLVALVTGYVWIGIVEGAAHFGMDTVKCTMKAWAREDQASVRLWTWIDQGFHVGCKLVWAWMANG